MDGFDCAALDVAGGNATAALDGDTGFVIGAGALGVLSLLLLLAGEALVRVLSAAVAGGAAAGSLYLLTDGTDCATRLWLAAGAGVAGAALVLCLLGSGFFVLGAGGFGALAHYTYAALPPGVVGAAPAWTYYAVVGGAALAGAAVARWERTRVTRLSSALLGGAGLALLAHLVAARAGGAVPAPALLGITVGAGAGGLAVQSRRAARRRRPETRA